MGQTLRKNVIVVGAGASKEFGLPTGAELTSIIASICDIRFKDFGQSLAHGDHRLVDTLRQMARTEDPRNSNINNYLKDLWSIRDNMALAPSIDNFLDTHRQNNTLVQLGKIAIVTALRKSEKESTLSLVRGERSDYFDFKRTKHTWLSELFKILVAQRDLREFLSALENITFVSFNYDRCIQQFFYFATLKYFDLAAERAAEISATIKIIYPYGHIGDIGFSPQYGSNFGSEIYDMSLVNASQQIRIFTEGCNSKEISTIRSSLEETDVVMFLGFGFLPINMELMFGDRNFPSVHVIGTGKGLSQNSRDAIEEELATIFSQYEEDKRIQDKALLCKVTDCTCSELFHEYNRFLIYTKRNS